MRLFKAVPRGSLKDEYLGFSTTLDCSVLLNEMFSLFF